MQISHVTRQETFYSKNTKKEREKKKKIQEKSETKKELLQAFYNQRKRETDTEKISICMDVLELQQHIPGLWST